MSGRKLDNAAYLASDWEDEVESKNILKRGLFNLSFSHLTDTSEPAILAGSAVEISGVVYVFDADYSITGSPADGGVFVRVYDSDGVAVAEYTNDALPAFDHLKNGYYDANGKRYVLFVIKASTIWKSKNLLIPNAGEQRLVIEIGDWNMDTTNAIHLETGLSDLYKIRSLNAVIRYDNDTNPSYALHFSIPRGEVGTRIDIELAGKTLYLIRAAGGQFDSTDFSATSYNRGWVTIWLEV